MAVDTFDQRDWDGANFELLRPDARRVLMLAQEEIVRSGHRSGKSRHLAVPTLTIEHLLIGLASAEGPAQELLTGLGIDADRARTDLGLKRNGDAERIRSRMAIPNRHVGFVIKFGFQVARTLSSDRVGGEHLLLTILLEGESRAAHLLEETKAGLVPVCQRLGADIDVVRATPRPCRS